MSETADWWNRLVALKQPSVGAIKSALGIKKVAPVFKDGPQVTFYLGHNVVLRIHPLAKLADSTPALSVLVILRKGFFPGPTLVVPDVPVPVLLLGSTIPCSGEDFAAEIHAKDPGKTKVSREPDGWTLFYGDALAVAASPTGDRPVELAQSTIDSVEFYYTMPFTGKLPLTMSDT